MPQFDILIIGAGPAGSTAASLFAKADWSVAVAEKLEFPRRKVCGEYLSPTNFPLFYKLGFGDKFLQYAGPEIRRVGLFAKSIILSAEMPHLAKTAYAWGRALRREVLDTMLLSQAVEDGVRVWQPWAVTDIKKRKDVFVSRIKSKTTNEVLEIESRIVIAAHGSWEIGDLPTQSGRQTAKDSDWLGFKAHFKNTDLAPDLMPMILFPGGYGGMVTCDGGFVSISCCIRRDSLQKIRKKFQGKSIGEAVQAHIFEHCQGVSDSLRGAERVENWLTAGIIKPGIRSRYKDGIFLVGNAAGESHPIIAEGISMAIQSSGLLHQCFAQKRSEPPTKPELRKISQKYDKLWLRAFRPRIRSADLFTRLAMSETSQTIMSPLMQTFPSLLTLGAKLGGKINQITD